MPKKRPHTPTQWFLNTDTGFVPLSQEANERRERDCTHAPGHPFTCRKKDGEEHCDSVAGWPGALDYDPHRACFDLPLPQHLCEATARYSVNVALAQVPAMSCLVARGPQEGAPLVYRLTDTLSVVTPADRPACFVWNGAMLRAQDGVEWPVPTVDALDLRLYAVLRAQVRFGGPADARWLERQPGFHEVVSLLSKDYKRAREAAEAGTLADCPDPSDMSAARYLRERCLPCNHRTLSYAELRAKGATPEDMTRGILGPMVPERVVSVTFYCLANATTGTASYVTSGVPGDLTRAEYGCVKDATCRMADWWADAILQRSVVQPDRRAGEGAARKDDRWGSLLAAWQTTGERPTPEAVWQNAPKRYRSRGAGGRYGDPRRAAQEVFRRRARTRGLLKPPD